MTRKLLADERCTECNKKLGKFDGSFSVICPRCSTLNEKIYEDKQRKELSMYMESYNDLLIAEEGRKGIMKQMFYDNKQLQDINEKLKEELASK